MNSSTPITIINIFYNIQSIPGSTCATYAKIFTSKIGVKVSKQFIIIVIVVVGILFGIFSFSNKSENKQSSSNSSANGSSHIVGNTKSKVTLIEYGDFQCPACKSYYPIVKQIKEEYSDRIAFQFKHFPLVQIHPNAFVSARAAEAAGKQGKFFEMHDVLYENQDSWAQSTSPNSIFESYAQQLGLNLDQFKKDMVSEEIATIINADVKSAQAIGGNSTPTFAINNKKIENPKTLDEFKKVIDEALEQNK